MIKSYESLLLNMWEIFWVMSIFMSVKPGKTARCDVVSDLCCRGGAPVLEGKIKSSQMLFVKRSIQILCEHIRGILFAGNL